MNAIIRRARKAMPTTPTANGDVVLKVAVKVLEDHLLAAVIGLVDRAAVVDLALMRLSEV